MAIINKVKYEDNNCQGKQTSPLERSHNYDVKEGFYMGDAISNSDLIQQRALQ